MASKREELAALYGKQNDSANEENRNKAIVRTSVIGIAANVMLAAFKAVIGVITGSVAITMDAVNNISDAGSSLITIIGTKLAAKPADQKHPFGYGRIEYLSAMIISVIVLYAGITSFMESVKKIISPEVPSYTTVSLLIVAVGVLVKILLGKYVKKQGQKTNSESLVNSGSDALNDSVISAATLAAALIYLASGVSLEAWLGTIISIVIIKSGIEMLKDTLSEILGEAAGADLARAVRKTILSHPEVRGVYDLIMNNYGPDSFIASVHIEVDDTMTMEQLDELTRRLTVEVFLKNNVVLSAVGIYSINTKDPEDIKARQNIAKVVLNEEGVRQIHGFHLDKQNKTIRFDLVIGFNVKDRIAAFNHALDEAKKLYPDYTFSAVMDTDFTGE